VNIDTYLKNTNTLLNEFCNKSLISDGLLNEYQTNIVASQISQAYLFIDHEINKYETHLSKNNIKCLRVDDNLYSRDSLYLSPLKEIFNMVERELSLYIKGCYLHGSLSSKDYIKGWSDVDLFIILNKSFVTDFRVLIKVRVVIQKANQLMKLIDPFQHHGIAVFSDIDLTYYLDTFIPLNSLGVVRVAGGGEAEINYMVKHTKDRKVNLVNLLNLINKTYSDGVLKHHAYDNEYLLANYKNQENGMYQMKYYLGLFLLVPSIYYGLFSDGEEKSIAIGRFKEVISSKSKDWIVRISNLRLNWEVRIEQDCPVIDNRIPDFVKEYIPHNYFEIGAEFSENILSILELDDKVVSTSRKK
jgi:hypothetical protein